MLLWRVLVLNDGLRSAHTALQMQPACAIPVVRRALGPRSSRSQCGDKSFIASANAILLLALHISGPGPRRKPASVVL